jgi:ATP-dependent Clp protease adaptor protein ClpS
MSQNSFQLKEKQNVDIREPLRYKVYLHNDDFTTMDFVVMVLKCVFFLNEETSFQLMLKIHHSDKAVVGVYSYDVAMSKVRKATGIAREKGFPLRLTIEQE